MSTKSDVVPDQDDLPQGPLPTWIHFSGQINYSQLAGEMEGDSLTVIWDDDDTMNENKATFARDGCRYKHVYGDNVSGTEAENVLVVLSGGWRSGSLLHEWLSRARNKLWIATGADTGG